MLPASDSHRGPQHAVITGPARMGGWGASLQPVVILGVQAKVTHIQTQLSCSGSSVVKNPSANAGDTRDAGSIPGSGRSPGVEMATQSRILSWEIPRTGQLGGLHSPGGCKNGQM